IVSAQSTNRVYGAANPTFSGTIVGVQSGDNITAIYTTIATPGSAIGDYPIAILLDDPNTKLGNYTVVTNAGTLTITRAHLTATPANATRVYGATNPTFTGVINGVQNGDGISAAYATSATQTSPVGDYPITA